MNKSLSHLRRNIPSVDKILESSEVLPLVALSSRTFVLDLLRQVLNNIRQELSGGIAKEFTDSDIQALVLTKLGEEFRRWIQPLLRRVINATGVLLHTNFGRAPLSHEAQRHLSDD